MFAFAPAFQRIYTCSDATTGPREKSPLPPLLNPDYQIGMEYTPSTKGSFSFANSILILPIVSIANLPQLAVDLLISSLQLDRVGILSADDLVPVAGGREDGTPGITTPLEVYGKKGASFFLIQQRSPVLKSRKKEFIAGLLSFIQSSKFYSVLVVTGVDLSTRNDSQMGSPVYHVIPNTTSSSAPLLATLKQLTPPFPSPSPQSSSPIPQLPSSGLTPLLFKSLPSNFPPTGLLLQYALEGDNREDAHRLAGILGKILGLLQIELREPNNWKQGLFGTPQDQTLFG